MRTTREFALTRPHTPPSNKQLYTSEPRTPAPTLDICQRQWDTAFSNPLIGFGLCDLDRRLLDGNQALERIVGRSIDELRASPAPFATHPDDIDANLAIFRAVASGQQEQGSYTKRYVHRDGTIVWCHVWLGLVRTRDNMPQRLIMLVVDITAQARAEQALRAQQLGLTAMELEILPFLAHSDLKTYPQIGARLHRSGETVRKHAQHLAEKLGLSTAARDEIVRTAQEQGLLNLASPTLPHDNG
jgi:PAS domain S-box-containing protein